MTTITISDTGIVVSGALTAGDTIQVELEMAMLPADASVRLLVVACPPPDARHIVAGSDAMTVAEPTCQMHLKTAELREALCEAHVGEPLPVVLEAVDEARDLVLGTLRYAVANSAALWRDVGEDVPIPDTPYTAVREALLAAQSAAAQAVKAADAHAARRDNPHMVTAEQIGALPLSGGAVVGDLTVEQNLNIAGQVTTASLALIDPVGGRWTLSLSAEGELQITRL